jgi:predicted lipoprotein with Yx(FWY)xxD motif
MHKVMRALCAAACLVAAHHEARAETGAPKIPDEVRLVTKGHGTQLTDAQGRSLYMSDADLTKPGTSTCVDACAVLRPPLLAKEKPAVLPEGWAIIPRNDGALQWTYKGRPLYGYARDGEAGAVFGAGDGWTLAFEPMVVPPETSIVDTVLGQALASADGKALYTRGGDGAKTKPCGASCERVWRPLVAPWVARDHGGFSVIARPDGVRQWAYRGQALYLYAGDGARAKLNGHGREGWQAMVLEPAPPVPRWVTIVGSDGGELYADAKGMALYRYMIDQNTSEQAYMGGNTCDEACLKKYWTPVSAETKQPRVGHWSVVPAADGGWQWAYKGMPLYRLNLETRPGELYYTTYRQFQWMKPIMYALPSLQGVF